MVVTLVEETVEALLLNEPGKKNMVFQMMVFKESIIKQTIYLWAPTLFLIIDQC